DALRKRGGVQEHLAAVLAGDETETLVGVEPLDLAGRHCDLLLCLSILLVGLLGRLLGAVTAAATPRATADRRTRLPGGTAPRRMHSSRRGVAGGAQRSDGHPEVGREPCRDLVGPARRVGHG